MFGIYGGIRFALDILSEVLYNMRTARRIRNLPSATTVPSSLAHFAR